MHNNDLIRACVCEATWHVSEDGEHKVGHNEFGVFIIVFFNILNCTQMVIASHLRRTISESEVVLPTSCAAAVLLSLLLIL